MATVQEPRAGSRFESFVEAELGRARRRIQAQDVGIAALGLLAGTLAYALAVVLLDRWLNLSDTARQIGLFGYLAAAVTYAALILSRPLRREVNPYFAARRVEQAVPGAKNSVISWLDLHTERLPASIKEAVTQKAAADLKRADVDEVVRDARLGWAGGIAGGLFVAILILFFLLRPNQFLSLLGRAFTPFGSGTIARQTTLNILQPAGGDVTVAVGSPIDFKVEVLGRVPDPTAADAVRLRFRYNPADPVWEEIRLDPSPRDPREFNVRVPSGRVQNGFIYKVVGGDAATDERRVRVRSSPLIERFEAVYHYRPYLRFRDQSRTNPNITDYRGTRVTLTAFTNRTVKGGEMSFQVRDGQKQPDAIQAVAVPDQPTALRFQFVLEADAKYQIRFESVDGEKNDEPIPYVIKVLTDHAPHVEITHPTPDTLPVNGTIALEGKADDDFGITTMRLCLQLPGPNGPTVLASKPYRPGKVFKFADDTYPRTLDYKDFLPLEQIKTPQGSPVALRPGLEIEYWLEAVDNCDYPKPNVGESEHRRVKLGDPQEKDQKQAADKAAAADQNEHNHKQDQDLDRQNQEKKEQAGNKGDQGDPNAGKPAGDQSKPGDDSKDKQTAEQEQKVRQALEKQRRDREQSGKGDAKSNPQPQAGQQPTDPGAPKGEQGDAQQPQPGAPKDQHGDAKADPKSGQQPPDGGKGEPKPDNPQPTPPDPGAAKPQPKPDGNPQQPNGNGGEPKQQPDAGAAKPPPQDGGANAAEKKDPPQNGTQPAESKPSDGGQKADNQGGNTKPNQPGQPNGKPPDQSADNAGPKPKPESAGGGSTNSNNNSGEQPGQGPKGDPNRRDPKEPPKPDDQGSDGASGNKSSGQPGGKAPQSDKPEDDGNVQGKGGAADAGAAKPKTVPPDGMSKGDGKPSNEEGDPNAGKPGTGPTGSGQMRDARNGGNDQKGDAPKNKPITQGTQAASQNSGTKPEDQQQGAGQPNNAQNPSDALKKLAQDLQSSDPQTRQAAEVRVKEVAKEMVKQSSGQKAPDAKDMQAAQERAKEMLKDIDKDPAGKQALADAFKKAAEQAAKDELQKLAGDLKSADANTREAAKERVKQLAQGALKPIADDAKSNDPQRQQKADDALKQNGEQDAQARKDLVEALKAGSKPGEEPKKPEPTGTQQQAAGRAPETAPPTSIVPPAPGTTPDPRNANNTADMQLERFPKNPSRDLLKELGMTAEQYRQFLKDAAELQKKKQQEAENNRERGGGTGASAGNTGVTRVKPTGDKKDALERGGVTLPPEEYRDGYKGFTEDVSKTGGGKK